MYRFIAASITALTIVLGTAAYAQEPAIELPEGEVSEARLELGARFQELSGNNSAFDEILPNVADRVKASLIRSNPQMQLGIIETVDKVALEMVSRRAELDKVLARFWATAFTEEELTTIIGFFETETGNKFASLQPRIVNAQLAAAERWGRIVGEEISSKVKQELAAETAAEARNLLGAGPAETAPQAGQ